MDNSFKPQTNMKPQLQAPIAVGTLVRTTEPKTADSEWMPEARASRRWNVFGTIIEKHGAHGPSYDVRHEDGTESGYDPSELEVVPGKDLEIVQLGNSILWKRAAVVSNAQDPAVQTLIDDMIHTCISAKGVGIAAPQVGRSLRIFIVASRPSARYPHAPQMEPVAMINPAIMDTSGGAEDGWEGCLSIPGIRGIVTREREVFVQYTDRNGNDMSCWFEGFVARIIQHEMDHINGKTFFDRAERKDLATEKEFERTTRNEKAT